MDKFLREFQLNNADKFSIDKLGEEEYVVDLGRLIAIGDVVKGRVKFMRSYSPITPKRNELITFDLINLYNTNVIRMATESLKEYNVSRFRIHKPSGNYPLVIDFFYKGKVYYIIVAPRIAEEDDEYREGEKVLESVGSNVYLTVVKLKALNPQKKLSEL